jgi:predicted nucleic acid-binding protein
MIVIDANVLLYAFAADSRDHDRARSWLERTFPGERDVRIGLTSILALLRVCTDPRVFSEPLSRRSRWRQSSPGWHDRTSRWPSPATAIGRS